MEAPCSSETLVDSQRTIRRYIPEDITLYNHRRENLKYYIIVFATFNIQLISRRPIKPQCLLYVPRAVTSKDLKFSRRVYYSESKRRFILTQRQLIGLRNVDADLRIFTIFWDVALCI
jgi:hypothetical protein